MKTLLRRIIQALLLVLGTTALPRLWLTAVTKSHIHEAGTEVTAPVAIVFGAGLYRDGNPTPVLEDRIATAASLYFAGSVKKLLLSGDNRTPYYNEPEAMRTYALKLGVPPDVLVLDYAGLRTYDTCYRANHIFGVQSALVVTQRFHLPRALYLCRALGIQAEGIIADRQYYRKRARFFWQVRETLADAVSLWEIHVSHPAPILGDPEPIFTTGAIHDP
ncbi:MAG: ElyC/SanA/YdcF family protein [Anaerolineales bacterium]